MPYRQVRCDYKPRPQWNSNSIALTGASAIHPLESGGASRRGMPRVRWLSLPVLSILTILLGGMASQQVPDAEIRLPAWLAPDANLGDALKHTHKSTVPKPTKPRKQRAQARVGKINRELKPEWQKITVRKGDNLSLIFQHLGLSTLDLDRIVALGRITAPLTNLYPGESLKFLVKRGGLAEIIYQRDLTHLLRVIKDTDGDFSAQTSKSKPEIRVSMTTASIGDSLFTAGQAAGLSDDLIVRLVKMFRWDIDFALDIHEGDRFAVVYEELYKDGKKIKDGEIVAAEFVNQGHTYRAVRFVDSRGRADYYTDTGNALHKAFIRTPVQFTRISSHFNPHRRHPILHTIRAHRGVDYAAPQGTPIKASGNGKVKFVGGQNGYGNAIILDHSVTYSTLYAHLSRFASRLRAGQYVRQGQIIGYVGRTGSATGPHLHYEFRVNGVHKNPLTVKLPNALPLEGQHLAQFKAETRSLLSKLDALAVSHTGPSQGLASTAEGARVTLAAQTTARIRP